MRRRLALFTLALVLLAGASLGAGPYSDPDGQPLVLTGASLGAGPYSDPSGQPLVLPVLVGEIPIGVTIVDPD